MSMSRALAVLALLCIPAAALAAPTSPVGYSVDESECASGGPTTYVFADGLVIREDCGDDCPIILEGSWKHQDDILKITWTKRFFGKGLERSEGPTPARTMFDTYAGAFETIKEADDMHWVGPDDADGGCVTIARHDKRPDARAFLRNSLEGRYPFTSTRAVTPADLEGLSADDLEIMRNEIYARYGHTFKNARLRKHFEAQAGYGARFTEVSAFLSPLERDNVSAILAAEKAAKKR